MYLIVGLGNPGKKYERTHHNAGFDVLEILAAKIGVSIGKLRCKALVGEGRIAGERVALAQPQTFMNLSGESAVLLLHWYKTVPERLIVVYDDVDLPLGAVRVRPRGGAGTHNGMKSIIERLGTDDFPRVRVGIGRPPESWDLADYVLSGYPAREEREAAYAAYQRAAEAIEKAVREGLPAAAAFVNAFKPPVPEGV